MAGLNFTVHVRNRNALSSVGERARDLSPAFEEIVNQWTYGNLGKFEQGSGAEMTGVQFDTVYWEALTPAYIKRKERQGFEGWLMKATGNLMDSMTNKESMVTGADIGPDSVSFGFPPGLDNPWKIWGNWMRRQVMFLSSDDMQIIKQTIKDYIHGRGKFSPRAGPTQEENTAEGGFDF